MLLQRIEKMKAKKLAGTQLIDSPLENEDLHAAQPMKPEEEKARHQDGVPND